MKLLKSIATISLITFLSRILGFIRDFLITKTFGIGESSDTFFIAFKFTNNLRRIFAEGAFSQSFIPILVEYKEKKSKEKNKFFISCVFGFLLIILVLITLIGCTFSSYIISLIAPGFSRNLEKFYLTSLILKITFPYILLISIASFFNAILNVWNNFIIPSISPICFNIVIIVFLLFFTKYFYPPILVLSYSILVGGICQILYQIPYLKFINMISMPCFKINHSGIYKIINKMLPSFIGLSISQISIIINNTISSFLIPGSISWVYCADRLVELPSGILGVAINTILLPKLSKNALINKNNYHKLMDWSLRLGLLLAIPSTAILCILAEPLIITLFKYNKFSYFDIYMIKQAVIFYSIGITGFFAMRILAIGFYANQDMKTPIIISVVCLIFNQFMNIFLVNILQHAALAFTISISISLNAIILYYLMIKKNIFLPQPGWKKFLVSLLIAVFFMSILLFFINRNISWYFIDNIFYRLLFLFLICLIGIFVYFFILELLKVKIIKFLKDFN